MKYVIYGDIGGHYIRLADSLKNDAGVRGTVIPKGVTVVQVGDLIHKGPDSDKLVAFVDQMMTENNDDKERGNWVQLMGNHESQYILAHPKSPFHVPNAPWFWNTTIAPESVATLWRWWDTERMTSHFWVEDRNIGSVLITHAGLSYYYLRSLMGRPIFDVRQPRPPVPLKTIRAAMRTARSLNRKDPAYLNSTGMMIRGFNLNASFIWAESASEVYDTWENVDMPFHQIHGHSTPFDWWDGKFYPMVPLYIQKEVVLDKEKRHSRFDTQSGAFYGIDPTFGKRAPWVLHPMILES